MCEFVTEVLRLWSPAGTAPAARRGVRWHAAASGVLSVGALAACIEPEPLFTDDVAIDGGAPSPAQDGAGGRPASMPPDESAGSPGDGEALPGDSDLPAGNGGATPAGPGPAPECDGADGGDGCAPAPAGEDPAGEDPAGAGPSPADDACDDCLAGVCPAVLARCDETSGCDEIVRCARSNGCEQTECYCGTINLILCSATGQANGPCRDVMLTAPGGHPPSLSDPSVGPAAAAASEVGTCRAGSDECRSVCGG